MVGAVSRVSLVAGASAHHVGELAPRGGEFNQSIGARLRAGLMVHCDRWGRAQGTGGRPDRRHRARPCRAQRMRPPGDEGVGAAHGVVTWSLTSLRARARAARSCRHVAACCESSGVPHRWTRNSGGTGAWQMRTGPRFEVEHLVHQRRFVLCERLCRGDGGVWGAEADARPRCARDRAAKEPPSYGVSSAGARRGSVRTAPHGLCSGSDSGNGRWPSGARGCRRGCRSPGDFPDVPLGAASDRRMASAWCGAERVRGRRLEPCSLRLQ